jgi:hypothetical protein
VHNALKFYPTLLETAGLFVPTHFAAFDVGSKTSHLPFPNIRIDG